MHYSKFVHIPTRSERVYNAALAQRHVLNFIFISQFLFSFDIVPVAYCSLLLILLELVLFLHEKKKTKKQRNGLRLDDSFHIEYM